MAVEIIHADNETILPTLPDARDTTRKAGALGRRERGSGRGDEEAAVC